MNEECFLQFESFLPFENVIHFSTTRKGGVSQGSYGSFNLSCYSGDSEENVHKNRQLLCQITGLEDRRLLVPYQVHGSETLMIEESFIQESETGQSRLLEGKDALLTSLRDCCLAVTTADCVPILLYAADRKVIGAVHAGWRGTRSLILQKTVEKMIEYYHCSPMEIYAVIGPSIGPDRFEVGDEVYEAFREGGFEMSEIAFRNPETGKFHIDLREANSTQLKRLGVPDEQIRVSAICTNEQSERFFSARKLGIHSGRMLTGICLT